MQPTVRRQVGCQQAGQSQRVTGGLHAAGGADARRHAQPRIRRFGDPRFILGSPERGAPATWFATASAAAAPAAPPVHAAALSRPQGAATQATPGGSTAHHANAWGPASGCTPGASSLASRRRCAIQAAMRRAAPGPELLGSSCRQRHGFLGRTLQRHRHAIRAAVGSHERPAVLRHFDAHVGAGLAQIGALTQIDGKAELGW